MSQRPFLAATLLAVSTVAASCTGSSTADRAAAVQPPGTTAPAPGASAAGPAAAAASASTAAPAADAATPTVSGPVVETMNASNYTYVRVKTSSGDIWAASSEFPVAVGDHVVVPLETPMANFHSKTLNRDFPMIYFASRIGREGEASSPPPPALALGHARGAGSQEGSSTAASAPVTPPQGGITIAQIWADRKSLAGKTVTVRGKVVKFNGGILDRNWIHLQDGSGQAADGTNDLLVTSSQTAKVGDVITATGKVAVDQDFTAGYAYKVMVEKATLK